MGRVVGLLRLTYPLVVVVVVVLLLHILRILGEKKKPVYFSTTWYYSYSAWKNKVIEGLRPECARQERGNKSGLILRRIAACMQ